MPTLQSDRTIDIPNIDPDNDAIDPDNWKDYVFSVQTLEESLGTTEYDFLSNVPMEIQDIIEERDRDKILTWIDDHELSSPLLADFETNNTNLNTISTDATIGHDSFVENSVFNTYFIEPFSPTQIGVTEVDVFEADLTESGVSENRSSKIDLEKASLSKGSTSKVNSFDKTITEATFVHPNASEISEAQVNFDERTTVKIPISKVGFPVNPAFDSLVSQSSTSPSSKIFFAPSVESEQFFSVHNSTLKLRMY